MQRHIKSNNAPVLAFTLCIGVPIKRYKYCGKEQDEETGLYYYGARYYAPWLCRFTSVDPKALEYVHQSSYVFADNNPIVKYDVNGEGTNGDGKEVNDNKPKIRNSTAVASTTSTVNSNPPKDFKIITPEEKKQQEKQKYLDQALKANAQQKLYGPNDPEYWNSSPTSGHYNPEYAHLLETKRAAANEDNLGLKMSIWFGYGMEKAGEFEIAARTVKKVVTPKVKNVNTVPKKDVRYKPVDKPINILINDVSSKGISKEMISNLGKYLSTKNLSDMVAILKEGGWTPFIKGASTTFYKEINGKRFFLTWNSAGTDHSTDGKPTQYWKLFQDKMSSSKVLFRASPASNYKSGGTGQTFIQGN